MALFVPDGVRIYEADMDVIAHLVQGNAVLSGGAISAQGSPNMSVNVAVGEMRYDGTRQVISTAANPIAVAAADPASPRIDLVRVQGTTGTPSIVTGTPGSTPKPPALTAGYLLLGYISVAAAAVNIQNANITQRQIVGGEGVMAGTLAGRPAATAVRPGVLFTVTDGADGQTLYRSNAVTWTQIAMGASAVTVTNPNLALNADFGRRTVFGLAMPEVYSDLNAWTSEVGALGAVAANIHTSGATGNWVAKWNGPAGFFADGRISIQFKATAIANVFRLWMEGAGSITNGVYIGNDGGTVTLAKSIAGVVTGLGSFASAMVLNNWYWLEVEKQGTTYTARYYSSGAAATTKAAATLVTTLTGTAADAALATWIPAYQSTATVAAQWGGVAASPGGVYVETWLPESWAVTFSVPGGQAVSYDEAVDSGPLGRQWALRGHIPSVTRYIAAVYTLPDGSIIPSTTYAGSAYIKTANKSGSGSLITVTMQATDSGLGSAANIASLSDAAEVAWTRKTGSGASASTSRRGKVFVEWNQSGTTAAGQGYVQLAQLEQGTNVTVWRNAPADDGMHIATTTRNANGDVTTTSVVLVEIDSRNLAMNHFSPFDETLTIGFRCNCYNSAAGNANAFDVTVDGVAIDSGTFGATAATAPGINYSIAIYFQLTTTVTAGKHRIAVRWRTSAGTTTLDCTNVAGARLTVAGTRGK